MIRPDHLERLACPDCPGAALDGARARLERGSLVAGELCCSSCGASFAIEDGVPWLMPAALFEGKRHGFERFPEEWKRWGERLEGFRKWRERTWGDGAAGESGSPREREAGVKLAARRRDAFAEFCGVIRGRALEVACGDGHLRTARGFRADEYWGVDPMPIAGAEYDFPFVAGVGERLPFRSGLFAAVLVKDSLHHFQDPGRFLDEARRVTAPGGALLLCQGVEPPAQPAQPAQGQGPGTRGGGYAAASAGSRAAQGAASAIPKFARRVAMAAKLLLGGEIGELRRRASRALGAGGAALDEGDEHFVWHLKRDDVDFEVRRRYEVTDNRLDGNVLYLRARA